MPDHSPNTKRTGYTALHAMLRAHCRKAPSQGRTGSSGRPRRMRSCAVVADPGVAVEVVELAGAEHLREGARTGWGHEDALAFLGRRLFEQSFGLGEAVARDVGVGVVRRVQHHPVADEVEHARAVQTDAHLLGSAQHRPLCACREPRHAGVRVLPPDGPPHEPAEDQMRHERPEHHTAPARRPPQQGELRGHPREEQEPAAPRPRPRELPRRADGQGVLAEPAVDEVVRAEAQRRAAEAVGQPSPPRLASVLIGGHRRPRVHALEIREGVVLGVVIVPPQDDVVPGDEEADPPEQLIEPAVVGQRVMGGIVREGKEVADDGPQKHTGNSGDQQPIRQQHDGQERCVQDRIEQKEPDADGRRALAQWREQPPAG